MSKEKKMHTMYEIEKYFIPIPKLIFKNFLRAMYFSHIIEKISKASPN